MSYQDEIYNQNGNCDRNQTTPIVNTSSDICVFNIPYFSMSGASKVECCVCPDEIIGHDTISGTPITLPVNPTTTYDCEDGITIIRGARDAAMKAVVISGESVISQFLSIEEFQCARIVKWRAADEELWTVFGLGTNFDAYIITDIYNPQNTIRKLTPYSYANNPCCDNQYGPAFQTWNNFLDLLTLTGTTNYYLDIPYTSSTSCQVNEIPCSTGSTFTTGSTNVYIINEQTGITIDFTFTANTNEFLDKNATFNFEIYKYNVERGIFSEQSLYTSEAFEWSSFSATSAFTTTIPISSLLLDGNYLVKGYYNHDFCTEFALLNGDKLVTPSVKLGSDFRLYEPSRDFYFMAFTDADKPEFITGGEENNRVGSLYVISQVLNGTETEIQLPLTQNDSDYILALNGLTLAPDYDYTISSISDDFLTATLSGATVSGDILTYIYTNGGSNLNTLRVETFDITSIPSGPTNGEGNNNIYYNTTTGKHEIYLSYTPVSFSDVIVTLNGAVLGNGIDYYQSISNSKRIIFEGTIIVGDIINVYYNMNASAQGNINNPNVTVSWRIETAPQTTDGLFTLQVSDSTSFTNIIASVETDYIISETSYSTPVSFTGNVGDTVYYRVKNEKSFKDICGNFITTTAYSDIIDITIQTNTINSY